MKYKVTLPEECGLDWRNLSDLGRFNAGECREVELDEGQKRSLLSKGFEVEPLEPAFLSDDEDELPASKPAKGEW
jgi:hypothetical protein